MKNNKIKIAVAILLVLVVSLVCFLIFRCDHQWEEATCIAPKTCTLCGKTKGKTIEHNYMDANCDFPKTCSYCDATTGKALGHNYVDGYCARCSQQDPDYVDLNNLGFTNTYGMNVWMDIDGYDFEENKVFIEASSIEENFEFGSYHYNYVRGGEVNIDVLSSVSSVTEDLFEDPFTVAYKPVANDTVTYSSDRGVVYVSIAGRYIDSTESKLVINMYREDWFGEKEGLCVPAGLLDFSTIKVHDEYDEHPNISIYSIEFK